MTRMLAVFAALAALSLAPPAFAQATSAAELRDALNLTPSQETAWQAYRAAIAPDPSVAARRKAAQALLPTVPTPQRIALIDAQMQADLDVFRRQGEAVKAFYATLTPTQQRVFDTQTSPRPGAMGGN